MTGTLNIDPGALNTWTNRRVAPSPLPASWFRPRTGQPRVYLVSDVLAWLAARRGEHLDSLTSWRLSLRTDFDTEVLDPDQVRGHAAMYAKAAGSVVDDVRFTPSGFKAYLALLLSSK